MLIIVLEFVICISVWPSQTLPEFWSFPAIFGTLSVAVVAAELGSILPPGTKSDIGMPPLLFGVHFSGSLMVHWQLHYYPGSTYTPHVKEAYFQATRCAHAFEVADLVVYFSKKSKVGNVIFKTHYVPNYSMKLNIIFLQISFLRKLRVAQTQNSATF